MRSKSLCVRSENIQQFSVEIIIRENWAKKMDDINAQFIFIYVLPVTFFFKYLLFER